ncbi:MAG: prepilin peptidase [Myxococcales bacterium]|nr:prepilin peptidase [Myxococcales bacterium]
MIGVAFIALALLAAGSDLLTRRIKNELVLVILAGGLVYQGLSLDGLAGAGVGFALLIIPFAARWVGGADVKVLAAFGAWLGPWGALLGGLAGIGLGGLLAVAMAVKGGIGRDVLGNLKASIVTVSAPVGPRRDRGLVVPLAVPLAVGCTLAWFGVLS